MDEGFTEKGKATGKENEEANEEGEGDEWFSFGDFVGDELCRDLGGGDGQADGKDGVANLLKSDFPQDEIFKKWSVYEAGADQMEADSGTAGFVLQAFDDSVKSRFCSRVGSRHGIAPKGCHGRDEDDLSVAALDHFRVSRGENLRRGEKIDPVDIGPILP